MDRRLIPCIHMYIYSLALLWMQYHIISRDTFLQIMLSLWRWTLYHPSCNGAVETFIQTFKKAIQASEKDGLSFQHRLANFLLMYRSTPHTTTGVSPATLFLGRNLRTRLDLIRPDIEQRVCEKQSQQKKDHDKWVKVRTFDVGERVMVKKFPTWT